MGTKGERKRRSMEWVITVFGDMEIIAAYILGVLKIFLRLQMKLKF